jgi:integrase
MPLQHCLTTRRQSAVPQFRRAIPADLQELFGRLELGGSLHTREKAEAKRRRNALVAATDSLFDDARMLRLAGSANRDALLYEFTRQRELICAGRAVRYSASPEPATEPCDVPAEDQLPCWPAVYDEVFPPDERPPIKARFSLKPSMIPRLIARRRAVMLHGDDVLRSTDSREDVRAMRKGLTELEQDITDDIARDDTSAIRDEALTLLAYEGIDLSRTHAAHLAEYLKRFLSAELDLIREQLGRLNASRTPTPPLPVEPLDTDDWENFIENWVSVRKPKEGTIASVRAEIARFRKFSSDKSPVDVTAGDVRAYVNFLLQTVSRNRVKVILSLIRPVVGTAIEEEITSLGQNPFSAVTVHVSEKDIRSYQPFSAGQLQTFFDGPVHRHGERPGKGGRDAAFWLPLLALFAGVRLEEAGTLTTASVFQRVGSYWIKIGESKSANSSLREVPVHGVLEEKGFIEFVERQRRQRGGNATLFPNLRPKTIDGKKTRMYSTWVNEYIDALVIDDAQYTFHSFRNNFEEALTCEGIAEDVRRALMGQAQSGMTRRYGKKGAGNRRVFPDRVLIEAMRRLTYEGLDLTYVTANANQPS